MDNNRVSGTIVEVREIGTNNVTKEFFDEDLSYGDVELKINCGYIWLDGLVYGKDEPSYGIADGAGKLVGEDYFREKNTVGASALVKNVAATNPIVADARICALNESFTKCKVYRLISYRCRGAMQHVASCDTFVDMAVKYEHPDVVDNENLEKRISKCGHIVELIYKACHGAATEVGKAQFTSIQSDFKQLHAELRRQKQQPNKNDYLPSGTLTNNKNCLAVNNSGSKKFLASITATGGFHQTGKDLKAVSGAPKPKPSNKSLLVSAKSCATKPFLGANDGSSSNQKNDAKAHCASNTQNQMNDIALKSKMKKLTRRVNKMTTELNKQKSLGPSIEERMQQLVSLCETRDAVEARAIASEKKIASLEANVIRLNKEVAKKDIKIATLDITIAMNEDIAEKNVEIARHEATLAGNEIIAKKDKKIAKLQADSNEASIKLKAAETELARLRR
ncbi:hypothetical protein H4R24_001924 [Coemansia sp. RSA 988]|nr:hypothetical protein H4R24_001924 [Coemansia sp. RSA 988]